MIKNMDTKLQIRTDRNIGGMAARYRKNDESYEICERI